LLRVGDIYETYDKEKSKKFLMDFDDLLVETFRLLTETNQFVINIPTGTSISSWTNIKTLIRPRERSSRLSSMTPMVKASGYVEMTGNQFMDSPEPRSGNIPQLHKQLSNFKTLHPQSQLPIQPLRFSPPVRT